jgi:hypothetical protein
VRGPTAQHPPEALNDIELGTIAWEPIQLQVRRGGSHLVYHSALMPGRIIDRDNNRGILAARIGSCNITQMRRKGGLQALVFALPCLGFAARGLLQQTRRQLAGHDIDSSKTIDETLVIPGPHQRAGPLHPQCRA